MTSSQFGLCGGCGHQRLVRNTRGSTFSLCGRSTTDDRYPRYPRMPVAACPGFQPSEREEERVDGTRARR